MDKLNGLIESVIEGLVTSGITVTSDDNCLDDLQYFTHQGQEYIVGEDHERDQWFSSLECQSGGKPSTFDQVSTVLTSVFGPPTKVHDLKTHKVNNWTVKDKKGTVLIVQGDSGIEFSQDYDKVAR